MKKNISSPNGSQFRNTNQLQQIHQLQNAKKNLAAQVPEIKRETTIGQVKLKTYFAFNHTCFEHKEDLIKQTIAEFNQKLDELIKIIYLTLTLREIHETRKWNNMLCLTDNTKKKPADQGDENSEAPDSLNQSLTSSASKDLDETYSAQSSDKDEHKDANKKILNCNCVWSVMFKLHRLHQTKAQKLHGTVDLLTPSSNSILASQQLQLQQQQQLQQSQQQQSQQQQHQQSQGLKKLQESLINFKIEESNCEDLYVYTKKNEIFLLKLEEVYEASSNANTGTALSSSAPSSQNVNIQNVNTPNQEQSLINSMLNDNSLCVNDSSVEINEKSISASTYAKIQQQQQQQQQNKLSMLSRRPSYGSVQDIDSSAPSVIYRLIVLSFF